MTSLVQTKQKNSELLWNYRLKFSCDYKSVKMFFINNCFLSDYNVPLLSNSVSTSSGPAFTYTASRHTSIATITTSAVSVAKVIPPQVAWYVCLIEYVVFYLSDILFTLNVFYCLISSLLIIRLVWSFISSKEICLILHLTESIKRYKSVSYEVKSYYALHLYNVHSLYILQS